MKILYLKHGMHHKNQISMLRYKNISLHTIEIQDLSNIDLSVFDCIYSPSTPIDTKKISKYKIYIWSSF